MRGVRPASTHNSKQDRVRLPRRLTDCTDRGYVPPRQQWGSPPPDAQRAGMVSPTGQPLNSIQGSPAVVQGASQGTRHARSSSEPYYEDVDPRFAVEEPPDDGYARDSTLPNALTPGGHVNPVSTPGAFVNTHVPGGFPMSPPAVGTPGSYGFPNPNANRMQASYPQHDTGYLHPRYTSGGGISPPESGSLGDSSMEQQDGTRSPAEASSERASEASHFTSISERPVNPNWRPGSEQMGPSFGAGLAPQRRQQDVILGANPDFSIHGMGVGRGARERAGSRSATAASNFGGGFTPGGRYPGDI